MKTMDTLTEFMPREQMLAVHQIARTKEGAEEMCETLNTVAARIEAMPKTYEQDGAGDAVAHLHYFTASADWYITERDIDTDGEGQHQAFGLADLFHDGGELGYISIVELCAEPSMNLDFHFEPRPIGELRRARAAA